MGHSTPEISLSTSEIISKSYEFMHKWRDYKGKETAESQTFWNEFFAIFGRSRREVAGFEESVKKLSGNTGRIDLFWPGKLLVEQKDPSQELNDKVHEQAFDYFHRLEKEVKPRYIILCNFKTFVLIDLEKPESERQNIVQLEELPKKIDLFSFIAGEEAQFTQLNEINIKAGRLMASLYDALVHKNPDLPPPIWAFSVFACCTAFSPTARRFLITMPSGNMCGTPERTDLS